MIHERLDQFAGDGDLGEVCYRAGCQAGHRAFQQRRGKRFAGSQRVSASVVVGGQQQNPGVVFGNFEASFGPTADRKDSSDTTRSPSAAETRALYGMPSDASNGAVHQCSSLW